MRLNIVADDLTGAADAALPFAEHGHDATVQLSTDKLVLPAEGSVVAVVASTRHLPADQARDGVDRVIGDLREVGFDTFFKKIDSTLRGNPGAEVEGALRASRASIAVVCPAFPVHGRTVKRGRAHVYGVALSETAVGRDLRDPFACDRIADVLSLHMASRTFPWV